LKKTKINFLLVFLLLSVFLYNSCVSLAKKTESAYSYLADSMDFYCSIPVQSNMKFIDYLLDSVSSKIATDVPIKSYLKKVFFGGYFSSQKSTENFQSVLVATIPNFVFSRVFSEKNGWTSHSVKNEIFFENAQGLQVKNKKGIGVFVSNGMIEAMDTSHTVSGLLDDFFLTSKNSFSFMIGNPVSFFSTFFTKNITFPIDTITGYLVDNSFKQDGNLETVACSLRIVIENQKYTKALMSLLRLLFTHNFSSITAENNTIVISDIVISLKSIDDFLQQNFNF